MNFFFEYKGTIGLLLITMLSLVGCSSDDDAMGTGEGESLLPYNSQQHIYATFGEQGEGLWEVVIDPATGQYNKILETEAVFSGVSSRLGARALTSFSRNERIYMTPSNNSTLFVQDLETFEIRDINLVDTSLDETIIFPQLLQFGADQSEVYLLDTDNSIWGINFVNGNVNKIGDRVPVDNGTTVSNMFYIESEDIFIGMSNDVAINDFTADSIFLFTQFMQGASSIISQVYIPRGFGFVQHPTEKNTIYYMQASQASTGFRLMKIVVNQAAINVSEVSKADLSIDNLSLYLQTIHTATNTYVLRGDSNRTGTSTNFLYSIDLDSGELIHEVTIEEPGILVKLAGE